jgi:dihydroflavonol-4-reductase
MRIGITGANGFIGNHLLRSALAKGHRPVALLQRGSSVRAIQDLEGRYEAIRGDLLDETSIDEFLKRCDVVFHLAGYNRYWARDPGVFRQVNFDGARKMAEGCLKHGIERLVHVSSCITLGASTEPVARNEESGFNLQHIRFPYAETKKAGEDEVRDWVRRKGLPAVIVNPASAVGDQDFGPTPIGKPIADICQGRWPVYVAGGACFIDVQDVVHGLWLALERGRKGEQYLLAGDNLTNRDFMCMVAGYAGVPRPKVKVPRPFLQGIAWTGEILADRVTRKEPVLTVGMAALIGKYLYFDGRKAQQELGFVPGPSARAIERCVKWFKSGAEAPGVP